MAINVRTLEVKGAGLNNFTTKAEDTCIVVWYSAGAPNVLDVPRWGGSGGQEMTSLLAYNNPAADCNILMAYLLDPQVGTYQLYSAKTPTAQGVFFCSGVRRFGQPTATGQGSSDLNDYLDCTVNSDYGDMVFYAGAKLGNAAWSLVDKNDGGNSCSGAYEKGVPPNVTGHFGAAGDAKMTVIGASLKSGGNFLPSTIRLLNGSFTFFKKAKAPMLPTVMYASPVTFTQPYAPTAAAGSAEVGAKVRLGDGSIPKDGEVIVRTNTETEKVYVKKGVIVPPPKRRIPGRI